MYRVVLPAALSTHLAHYLYFVDSVLHAAIQTFVVILQLTIKNILFSFPHIATVPGNGDSAFHKP